jgi:hypothetical protein
MRKWLSNIHARKWQPILQENWIFSTSSGLRDLLRKSGIHPDSILIILWVGSMKRAELGLLEVLGLLVRMPGVKVMSRPCFAGELGILLSSLFVVRFCYFLVKGHWGFVSRE